MNFDFKNIYKHGISTFLGVLIVLFVFFLVWKDKATFAEAIPILLVAIPFLLYGENRQEPPKAT